MGTAHALMTAAHAPHMPLTYRGSPVVFRRNRVCRAVPDMGATTMSSQSAAAPMPSPQEHAGSLRVLAQLQLPESPFHSRFAVRGACKDLGDLPTNAELREIR